MSLARGISFDCQPTLQISAQIWNLSVLTHEAPRGSGPRARVSGTRSARKAYLVSRAWASAGSLGVTRALLGRGDMVVQGRLLMTMIETAVENAPQLDQILPAVRDLDEMWPRSAA